MTLSDPLPGFFPGNGIFKVEYLKYLAFYGRNFYRTLIENHTQSIEWYHFQWPWVTSDPDFQVATFLKSNIGNKDKIIIAQEEKYLTHGIVGLLCFVTLTDL